MKENYRTAEGQAALWNGRAGQAWIDAQASLDRMFKPFEERLVQAVAGQPAKSVLDVGCGTGGTTLAVARQTGAACLGVDISRPMIAVAQARAKEEGTPAHFLAADAQSHVFEPASFDMIISRFGVMFFDDPVAAFTNLRSRCRAWRSTVLLCLAQCRGESVHDNGGARAPRPSCPICRCASPTRRASSPSPIRRVSAAFWKTAAGARSTSSRWISPAPYTRARCTIT